MADEANAERELRPVKLLYIARSDGKKTVWKSESRLWEENKPTESQLEKSIDEEGIESFYQAVPMDHNKSMEWRRKLCIMLMKKLEWPIDDNYKYYIVDFPENYHLFEHCKGNRRDYYLYSHPGGREKRYRSPAEFLPHLLWLAIDPDEIPDRNRCSCKYARQERRPAPIAPIVLPQPTKLAPTGIAEQEMDFQCDKYLYRPGEIVWFNRGSSWGLSVILARGFFKNQKGQDRPEYNVVPLSHPNDHPQEMTIDQEDSLRPWLAFSPPTATDQAHNSWAFSISAAKAVDLTYTPFEPLEAARPNEVKFNGVFVGGEKIWVGEAVRLRIGTGKDIMILHHIDEASDPRMHYLGLLVTGDIYTFETIPYESDRPIPENPCLPIRVREDLKYRTRATITHKKEISFWKLTHASVRLGLASVKGRWYESRVLLPIIQSQAAFDQLYARGEMGDVNDKLNGRGDDFDDARINNSWKLGRRKANRLGALVGAVIEGMAPRAKPDLQKLAPWVFEMETTPTYTTAGGDAMDVDGDEGVTEVNDDVKSESIDVRQMDDEDDAQSDLGNLGRGG